MAFRGKIKEGYLRSRGYAASSLRFTKLLPNHQGQPCPHGATKREPAWGALLRAPLRAAHRRGQACAHRGPFCMAFAHYILKG